MTNLSSQPILSIEQSSAAVDHLETAIQTVIRGKATQVRLAVSCLLSEGHLLIEDKPGTGKTSLARAIAAAVGAKVRRVQFTPDLLPSDITGVSVFNPVDGEFRFREGPAFTNILVADEINRASPKTQAALLEVMEERTITSDGVSRAVPSPFMVVATQNPLDFQGTYPLPEVQLDRFAMKLSLGYADRASELEVMDRGNGTAILDALQPAFDPAQLPLVLDAVQRVTVSRPLKTYVIDIVEQTRSHRDLRLGVSTRGTLILLGVARAFALASGRSFVTPDDIKSLCLPVLSHRIALTTEAEIDGLTAEEVMGALLDQVEVPRGSSWHETNN